MADAVPVVVCRPYLSMIRSLVVITLLNGDGSIVVSANRLVSCVVSRKDRFFFGLVGIARDGGGLWPVHDKAVAKDVLRFSTGVGAGGSFGGRSADILRGILDN